MEKILFFFPWNNLFHKHYATHVESHKIIILPFCKVSVWPLCSVFSLFTLASIWSMVYLSFIEVRDLMLLSANRWRFDFREIHFTPKKWGKRKKKTIFAIKDSSNMQSSCCIKICDLKKFIQCYWLFILCLVSIKFPSFVYCAVSWQRNCKFSAFWADSWIPCLSVRSNQTEPAPFWPLAGSLAGA